MALPDIYTQALCSLTEAERVAVETYMSEMSTVSREKPLSAKEQVRLVNEIQASIPGSKRALRHYDLEVGKLMK